MHAPAPTCYREGDVQHQGNPLCIAATGGMPVTEHSAVLRTQHRPHIRALTLIGYMYVWPRIASTFEVEIYNDRRSTSWEPRVQAEWQVYEHVHSCDTGLGPGACRHCRHA